MKSVSGSYRQDRHSCSWTDKVRRREYRMICIHSTNAFRMSMCSTERISHRKAVLSHSVLEGPLSTLRPYTVVTHFVRQCHLFIPCYLSFPLQILICYFPPPWPRVNFFTETHIIGFLFASVYFLESLFFLIFLNLTLPNIFSSFLLCSPM